VKKTLKPAVSSLQKPKVNGHTLHGYSLLTDHDIYLFKQGNHFQLYRKLGSHIVNFEGTVGTYFAVWAPNAESVAVVGDFNDWNRDVHQLKAGCKSS